MYDESTHKGAAAPRNAHQSILRHVQGNAGRDASHPPYKPPAARRQAGFEIQSHPEMPLRRLGSLTHEPVCDPSIRANTQSTTSLRALQRDALYHTTGARCHTGLATG